MRLWSISLCAAASTLASEACADGQTAALSAATPAAPASATPATFSIGMDGPIVINPSPYTMSSGPLGSITINGAVSALAFAQSNPAGGDHRGWADMTNAQLLIEKTDGLVQFFIDVGAYSFPTVGTPYTRASKATANTFGAVPAAYLKLAPNSSFSIEAGKLPTLIGAEYNFTFQNPNIERGALWNQENTFNRGIQANYTIGSVSLNLSINDGYYSNALSWISGAATWSINSSNTLAFSAGGATRLMRTSTLATPLPQNNSTLYNLILTHTQGQWTIQPYLQYTYTPTLDWAGTTAASTFGGAVFVTYAFPSTAKLGDMSLAGFSVPGRLEYISQSGSAGGAAANLLYGPGSSAWSITVTPTYQWKIYYIRGELSCIEAEHVNSGLGFGASGAGKSQTRSLLELGALF